MNIASLIFQNRSLGSPAFADMGQAARSYGELEEAVLRLVAQLALMESAPQDRIALTAPRGPLGLIYFLAISSLMICCPLDPRLKDDEMEGALSALSVKALVDATQEKRFESLAGKTRLPLLRPRLDLSGGTYKSHKEARGHSIGLTTSRDPALILQTSGTTSAPKLVALTHSQILAAAQAIKAAYNLGPDDLCLNPMPHYHVHGLISAGLSSLVAGAAQHCATSFSAEAFEAAFNTFHPTWFTGSPAFHLGLFDHFKFKGGAPLNARLRFVRSSSAPFPASMIGPYESLFGVPLLENYGMTETSSTICSNPMPPRKRKTGSVGLVLPGAELRVAGDDGLDVAQGAEGEILVRGPSVITSYASNIGNATSFLGPWLRTGDIGRFDEEGYLFVLGRSKELIKRGGHSVYPLEIDSAILAYPLVAEALTFSIAHPTLGEELVAILVARPDAVIDLGALRDFLEERLSTYKIPNAFYSVAGIPKNDTGKAVRRQMASHFGWLSVPASVPAASPSEELLLRHWREVLLRDDIGVTDNVFVFGADTLRAQRVCEMAGSVLQIKDMLRNPAVRDQAVLLSRKQILVQPEASSHPFAAHASGELASDKLY